MSAQTIVDILGCDYDMAVTLLEIAGGDEGLAIELGLGGGAAQAGGADGDFVVADSMMNDVAPSAAQAVAPATSGPASSGAAALLYPLWNRIWPSSELSPAWKQQRLDVIGDETCDGILQPLNGPCGVLAVVQGELWLQQQQQQQQTDVSSSLFEQRLSAAIANILSRVIVANKDSGGGDGDDDTIRFPTGTTMTVQEASQSIRTARELVEAIAATARDVSSGSSLVEGPHSLCSSDLMCLLLRGKIGNGSFAAWDSITRAKTPFYTRPNNCLEPSSSSPMPPSSRSSCLGMLSYSETQEAGIRVADDLKLNRSVWVLHTGDHFLTMRKIGPNNRLHVYNGLPPVGPKSTYWTLSGDDISEVPPAPDKLQETFVKKRPGQPDDIVQASKTSSLKYQDWTFEVVPAVDDPDVQGPVRDDDPSEPVYNYETLPYDMDSRWRCAFCYATRFQTMNFGLNAPGTEFCSACQKYRRHGMWSIWQSYSELSPRMKQRARQMYANKIELILATLYPNATITESES